MMKILSTAFALVMLASCATSFDKTNETENAPPAWYESARKEIIGEGYPDLGAIPVISDKEVAQTATSFSLSRDGVQAAREFFATHPRAATPVTTQIEIAAFRERLIAKLDGSGPLPRLDNSDDFLTPADIARFKEIFRRAELR